MILNRMGNKKRIAEKIIPLFPVHDTFIDLFFGAGGIYFNKPKSKYNILNDIDYDVYNLFRQVIDNKDELVYWLERTPIEEKQFKIWAKGQRENSDALNAVRFLILSNFSLYGKMDTLKFGNTSRKEIILSGIDSTIKYLADAQIMNCCFRKVLNKIDKNIKKIFIYADPPYLGTIDNYSDSFREQDSFDLFEMLCKSGHKFAMSEFDNPFILSEARRRGLNVNIIGERLNIKNRRTEILITNYETVKGLF